jgi:hypothetical protein
MSPPVLRFVHRDGSGQRLAVVFFQHGLWIEGVYLRHAAVHEQEDNALGFGLEMRVADHPRVVRLTDSRGSELLPDQAGEAEHTEASAHPAKSFAPG